MATAKTAKTTTKAYPSNVTPLELKPSAPKPTPEQRQAQAAFVEVQLQEEPVVNNTTTEVRAEPNRVAQLRAEQKRIAEELKALKASQPSGLEREIAKQLEHPNAALVYTLRASLRGRLLYGQSVEDAIEGIVTQCRALLESTPAEERIRKMPTPLNRKATTN